MKVEDLLCVRFLESLLVNVHVIGHAYLEYVVCVVLWLNFVFVNCLVWPFDCLAIFEDLEAGSQVRKYLLNSQESKFVLKRIKFSI